VSIRIKCLTVVFSGLVLRRRPRVFVHTIYIYILYSRRKRAFLYSAKTTPYYTCASVCVYVVGLQYVAYKFSKTNHPDTLLKTREIKDGEIKQTVSVPSECIDVCRWYSVNDFDRFSGRRSSPTLSDRL